ncbi:MAG: FAD-binding oxidoreductase [Chloroflexota bacterium]|nr:FAD-binding oxidoreductase [Chloroflexota bacterium]
MPVKCSTIPADRISDDPLERKLYSRDLAPVPAIMVKPFFRTLPDAIVRPGSAGQVAEVMRHAAGEHIAVTPRAAASTSLYNAVPVRGGLVLDVNDLRGEIAWDAARQTVRVLPATTWFELDETLRRKGFAVKSYPSSAVSATVGGWVSTQGHGLGSLKYGGVGEQLVSLQVVLPNGEQRTVTRESDPPLDWFVAAEGTLGVITEVELTIRPRPAAESHHLFAFDDLNALGQSAAALAHAVPRPFTVFFADSGYLRLLLRAGFPIPLDLPETLFPISERSLLLVSFQGEPSEVNQGKDALTSLSGRELSADLALEEWNLRLYHLRAKRAGPSLLAAESWLPLDTLPHYLKAIETLAERHRLLIGTYGLAVAPDKALVMSLYPSDERHTVAYLAAIGFSKRLYDLSARYGGRPYGVGLWNVAYLQRLFSQAQLEELRKRKARLDPLGIMNPGKLYRASFPLWPITFGLGAAVLGAAHVALGRERT